MMNPSCDDKLSFPGKDASAYTLRCSVCFSRGSYSHLSGVFWRRLIVLFKTLIFSTPKVLGVTYATLLMAHKASGLVYPTQASVAQWDLKRSNVASSGSGPSLPI